MLSDYLRDKPQQLTAVILVADELAEFSPLVEALKPHAAAVKQPLLMEMQAAMPVSLAKNNEQLSESDQQLRDAHWQRQSLAAVTLVHLGYGDDVWSLLKFSPDPSLRSLIIYYLGKLGTNPNTLAARLQMESEVSIRRALVQSLGGLDAKLLPVSDRNRITEQLNSLYVNDPDSGIHSSASWALRKLGAALPELPVGEPVLTDEQKTRLAKLTVEVEAIRQRLVISEQELPARQAAWERQLREQPEVLPASLRKGLVAHYPLDETEGKQTANRGEGQSGGVYGGPGEPAWVPGVFGNAVRLDGKGGHFECGEAFSPERTDAFSYGCWFNADTESQRGVLFSKFANADEQGFAVNVDPVAGDIICEWSHHYPDDTLIVRAKVPEIAGQWQHLFVVYDSSSKAAGVTVHVNGRPVPLRAEADRLSESIQVSSLFQIGKRDTQFAFQGVIDDVRIYSRRLDEGEVQRLYASGIRALVNVPAEIRTPEQKAMLSATYRRQDEPLQRLQRQLAAAETSLRDGQWNSVRRWYVNGQGQTMMVIPTAAADSKSQLTTGLAISSHEVTVAEFLRFREKHGFERRFASSDDCPVHNVSWYEAVEYCNWLSQQEGIPEDQWVYQPNDQGQHAEGMKIREKLAGYRLPTNVEWESSCRAGTSGSYCFGEPFLLLKQYGWSSANSSGRSYSAETLLPNEAGLFDMHGNLWEWTQNPTSGQSSPVTRDVVRVLRGGSFAGLPSDVRSAFRYHNGPSSRYFNNGFRVARSLPPVPLTSLPPIP